MPNRRDFLEALGLTPFAIAAATSTPKLTATPVASPIPEKPPEDPLKELKAFAVPDSVEPVAAFAASRGSS